MNDLYRFLGITKQGYHKRLNREAACREEQMQLLRVIKDLRKEHPCLSSREMYFMISPKTMGRDVFEQYCFQHGYRVKRSRNYVKTTDSRGVNRFPNLLLEVETISAVDQVWVSDITYFRLNEEMWYLTFILDLYSRHILGYAASQSLRTAETTLKALMMSQQIRQKNDFKGLIAHSDGGGQYYSHEYVSFTKKFNIRNSMCENVYANAHAERINGTIKNDYLIPYGPKNSKELVQMLDKAVYLYNNKRPHKSLNRYTPVAFESAILKGTIQKTWPVKKELSIRENRQINIKVLG